MNREKTFIVLVCVAVGALLVWKMRQAPAITAGTQSYNPNESIVPTPANTGVGLEYMIYNQPFMFSPPVQNIMPYLTNGAIGQNANSTAQQDRTLFVEG